MSYYDSHNRDSKPELTGQPSNALGGDAGVERHVKRGEGRICALGQRPQKHARQFLASANEMKRLAKR